MSSRRARERFRRGRVEFMEKLNEAHNARDREEKLDAMTKAELIEYADDNGIKIDKTAKKAEILEKIKE